MPESNEIMYVQGDCANYILISVVATGVVVLTAWGLFLLYATNAGKLDRCGK